MKNTIAAYWHAERHTVSVDGFRIALDITSLSMASQVIENAGFTLVGEWMAPEQQPQSFSILVEEDATVSHVWPADVDLGSLRHHLANGVLTDDERKQIDTLLDSVDVARNTYDSFPVKYPMFSREQRNSFLVGTLAGILGRRTHR